MYKLIVDDEHGNVLEIDCRLTNPKLWKEWKKLVGDFPHQFFVSESYVKQDLKRLKQNEKI